MSSAGEPRRLVLIDGYSNVFRAFYAIRELSNSKGEPTNAVYGFVQMLRKLLREQAPDFVGVALDVSGATIRDQKYEHYKANRAPMPEELRPQIPWIRKAIEAHRIPILELEGYEADDVLGTLAKKAAEAGFEVTLVSSDKDLMQLVDEHVSLLHTGRNKTYDPAAVEEDLGVPPAKVAEMMALKGDSVDNVPGVPGIGEKGAVQLIREFGGLDELLERADEVPRKSYREGLQNHQEQALLSRELVTIHTDLAVDFDPESLRVEPPDTEALRALFRDMEFHSLLAELEGSLDADPMTVAEEISSAEEWERCTGRLSAELGLSVIGVDEPLGIGLAREGSAPLFADFRHPGMRESVRGSLRRWLSQEDVSVVGHDLKRLLRLAALPRAPKARLVDTMLLSYVLRPAARGHDLEALALDRLGYTMLSAKQAELSKRKPPAAGHPKLLAWAGERTELARRLAPSMVEELGGGALSGIYWDLEVPLISVLVAMEEAGILLDRDLLAAMSSQLQSELDALQDEIHELAGEVFNINSPQQLGVVLFEKLGYPVLRKTRKTKSYSTSAETLQELVQQGFPLPERLLRYRELSKLKSTYVDALPALVGADGRLHTRFQQAVAATGRLSSTSPNLQNIPVRSELGQQIRKAFIAPPGKALLVADYNQIELRVLAHVAGDRVLIESFLAGEDIHRSTAAVVFGIAPEMVSLDQRRAAKVINFGIIYGISPFGLARNLGIHPGEAERFIASYFERHAGVQRYMEETVAEAEESGQVETLFGRVRQIPEIHSRNRNTRDNARRMAINARIQGTAADLMKRAMITLHRRLQRDHAESRLLLTVHDELVLEVPEREVEAVSGTVTQAMAGVERLAVPLVVDVGHGRSWYDAKS